jgi:hypothetical protein
MLWLAQRVSNSLEISAINPPKPVEAVLMTPNGGNGWRRNKSLRPFAASNGIGRTPEIQNAEVGSSIFPEKPGVITVDPSEPLESCALFRLMENRVNQFANR